MTREDSTSPTGEHEMRYRAGFQGFGIASSPPCYYCTCGGWVMLRTTVDKKPYQRSFMHHVETAR